ncbi:hypothetical protein IW150_005436 [Coemansia sp. RSA 2607]|nr:hypothetical protein IW150_005436 [Coemansia sp. RSA 2607]
MESLIRDCDKLAKHQSSAFHKTLTPIDQALTQLLKAKEGGSAENLRQALTHIQKLSSGDASASSSSSAPALRELSTNVSKYGKHVEKTFKHPLDTLGDVSTGHVFAQKHGEHIGRALVQHFVHSGQFSLATVYASEAQVQYTGGGGGSGEEEESKFREMFCVAREIQEQRNVERAVAWAAEQGGVCEALEFELRRLRFLQLVEAGEAPGALTYARTWFPKFASTRMPEIEHLMGIFIYAKRLGSSPYAEMFCGERWRQGAAQYVACVCRVLGVPLESPVRVAVDAGALAVPVVGKVAGLMRDRRVEWSQQDELAVEVPLPGGMRFHSVFACPVSKEQATVGNPPMALPCGHVVCRGSLEKLARGVRPGVVASGRFKCPYCPVMASLADARAVHF